MYLAFVSHGEGSPINKQVNVPCRSIFILDERSDDAAFDLVRSERGSCANTLRITTQLLEIGEDCILDRLLGREDIADLTLFLL